MDIHHATGQQVSGKNPAPGKLNRRRLEEHQFPELKKSFAAAIASPSTVQISSKKPDRYKGYPAISFSVEEVNALAAPYQYSLVGNFPKSRPPLEVIRACFHKIGFKEDLQISLLAKSIVLLKFICPLDYQRCFTKRLWKINGSMMLVSKWKPDFHVDKESTIFPIWITLEHLPIHLHDSYALLEIAKLIGKPLMMDSSTASKIRPSVARFCVEIDVSRELPHKIWILNGTTGFFQPVTYENLPNFCRICHTTAHPHGKCSEAVEIRNPAPTKQNNPPAGADSKPLLGDDATPNLPFINEDPAPANNASQQNILENCGAETEPNVTKAALDFLEASVEVILTPKDPLTPNIVVNEPTSPILKQTNHAQTINNPSPQLAVELPAPTESVTPTAHPIEDSSTAGEEMNPLSHIAEVDNSLVDTDPPKVLSLAAMAVGEKQKIVQQLPTFVPSPSPTEDTHQTENNSGKNSDLLEGLVAKDHDPPTTTVSANQEKEPGDDSCVEPPTQTAQSSQISQFLFLYHAGSKESSDEEDLQPDITGNYKGELQCMRRFFPDKYGHLSLNQLDDLISRMPPSKAQVDSLQTNQESQEKAESNIFTPQQEDQAHDYQSIDEEIATPHIDYEEYQNEGDFTLVKRKNRNNQVPDLTIQTRSHRGRGRGGQRGRGRRG